MDNFSFVVNNIVVNEFQLLENLLCKDDVYNNMQAIFELNEIKSKLIELEHKVRFKGFKNLNK